MRTTARCTMDRLPGSHPAAALFYNYQADDAVNYGIGAVIGHEISTASTTRAAATMPKATSKTGGRKKTGPA